MARTKLVCNLGLADFFTLPDSRDAYRKEGGDPCYVVKNGKRIKIYECANIDDNNIKIWLSANMRVDLIED